MVHPAWQALRLTLGLLLAALLTGCGGQLLSRREIVRAAFFAQGGDGCTVALVVSDQKSEDSAACKTVSARASSYAAAWDAAEQSMDGSAFYGLMDLAVLPAGGSRADLETIAELLEQNARPAPEISVFALDAAALPQEEEIPALYDALRALEAAQELHCGLQMLFDSAGGFAVPVSDGKGYEMLFYAQDGTPTRITDPAAAALAAVLCGQAGRLDCTLAQELHLSAAARAAVEVSGPHAVTVRLRLCEVSAADLSGQARREDVLRAAFEQRAQQAFAALLAAVQHEDDDPLDLRFWLINRTGVRTGAFEAALEILW